MNVKNLVLGIGIFIVYLMMLHYGVEAFYSTPLYENYCSIGDRYSSYYPKAYPADVGTNCTFSKTLFDQEQVCVKAGGFVEYDYDDKGCTVSINKCNYCQKEFNEADKSHSQTVFLIALIVGILTLVAGYFVSMDPVGSALMASGIGAMFYGSTRNWANLSDIWRFLLLVIALVLLIWMAIRINSQKKKSWVFWKKR